MVKCNGCQEPAYAVHKEDINKSFRDRRLICKDLYEEYSRYHNGAIGWIIISPTRKALEYDDRLIRPVREGNWKDVS